jgi:hypothetical protein
MAEFVVQVDPKGARCPGCLTELLVVADGTRECPQGDYREGVDRREPLGTDAEQAKTVVRDERVRAARARLGDMAAASETPAQTYSRIAVSDPGWLREWLQSPEADDALAYEHFLAPGRGATDHNVRSGQVRTDTKGPKPDLGKAPLGATVAPHYRATPPEGLPPPALHGTGTVRPPAEKAAPAEAPPKKD